MGQIVLTKVRKAFGEVEVIPGIDLQINDGEFVVFVGPSGCGKSTLLRLIAGLEDISSGKIEIDGNDATDAAPGKRGLAMVFQSYALYPHMTVGQNLAFGLRMNGNPEEDTNRRVKHAAEILQIGHLMERRPKALSGGQRQRVAIGRAIVREPQVFLFDEPLSNLDAELRVQMRVEIARLHKELGATMIYVTHDQTEAMTLADKIVVLRGGNVEQIGRPLDLYDNPANMFVAGFVGSPKMNFLAARVVNAAAGAVTVELVNQGGAHLTLPLKDIPTPGTDVILGLRPEHFASAGAGDCDIVLNVDVAEHLGATSYVYVGTGTKEPLIIERHEFRYVDDKRLTVGIPAKRALLFAKNGARLY